jgi:hypothetical protein
MAIASLFAVAAQEARGVPGIEGVGPRLVSPKVTSDAPVAGTDVPDCTPLSVKSVNISNFVGLSSPELSGVSRGPNQSRAHKQAVCPVED